MIENMYLLLSIHVWFYFQFSEHVGNSLLKIIQKFPFWSLLFITPSIHIIFLKFYWAPFFQFSITQITKFIQKSSSLHYFHSFYLKEKKIHKKLIILIHFYRLFYGQFYGLFSTIPIQHIIIFYYKILGNQIGLAKLLLWNNSTMQNMFLFFKFDTNISFSTHTTNKWTKFIIKNSNYWQTKNMTEIFIQIFSLSVYFLQFFYFLRSFRYHHYFCFYFDFLNPQLDNHEIKPGKCLKINISVPNLRLFVGNIPKSKGKEEILDEFGKLTGNYKSRIRTTNESEQKSKIKLNERSYIHIHTIMMNMNEMPYRIQQQQKIRVPCVNIITILSISFEMCYCFSLYFGFLSIHLMYINNNVCALMNECPTKRV